MTRGIAIAGNTAEAAQYNGAATNYLVRDNSNVLRLVFIDRAVDVLHTGSVNDGLTWSNPGAIFTGSAIAVSTWYGRWSNLANDKIYVAYTETGGNDILFRTIDTASGGALGTQTTVFNGASAAGGAGSLSIVVDRAGNVRVVGSIDAGVEDGAWSSTDDGATWGDTIADPSEGATQDQYYALPGWNSDTSDFMVIFVDASANGLSVKRYDDSANTWAEAAIIADGSFVDLTAGNSYPHVACCVDIANSRNIVVAWTAVDTANADLRLFFVTDTTITESAANVVLNSTDDQGLCAVGLDTATGTIYVFYGGKSDGSETFNSSINIYYKTTTDDGTTWSTETLLTSDVRGIFWLACTPRFASTFAVAFYNDIQTDDIQVSAPIPSGTAGALLTNHGMTGGING